jgi:hypothetical protein
MLYMSMRPAGRLLWLQCAFAVGKVVGKCKCKFFFSLCACEHTHTLHLARYFASVLSLIYDRFSTTSISVVLLLRLKWCLRWNVSTALVLVLDGVWRNEWRDNVREQICWNLYRAVTVSFFAVWSWLDVYVSEVCRSVSWKLACQTGQENGLLGNIMTPHQISCWW